MIRMKSEIPALLKVYHHLRQTRIIMSNLIEMVYERCQGYLPNLARYTLENTVKVIHEEERTLLEYIHMNYIHIVRI